MVTTRQKRSTAGNRLKQLLDQELEKDEIFTEVENDIDFEANEDQDGVDIVDSDFDRDSDDDAKGAGDESEGEREIERQEKEERSKRRAAARTTGVLKRPTSSVQKEIESKRRRISFAPTASTPAAPTRIDGSRRSSNRSATVQSKLQVQSRLSQAEERRASAPTKAPVRKKERLTQDALIAEALEVEEENRESLRRFLEMEEERRAKGRLRKERIQGPFVRWVSVGLKVKRPAGEEKEGKKGEGGEERVRGDDEALVRMGEGLGEEQRVRVETVIPPPPGEQTNKTATIGSAQAPAPTAMSAEAEKATPLPTSPLAPPAQEPTSTPAAQTHSTPAPQAPSTQKPPPNVSSTSNLTLDPAIAARTEASSLRLPPPRAPLSTPSSPRTELQARTLLSLERAPEDFEWIDEFSALLGDHVRWDAYPYVPSRNRPLKPRQSICPITGLPAVYKDPRTGIPYANSYAYKVITRVLESGFVWTGGHYEQRQEEGDGRRKKEKGVGKGAAPVQMGIYVDDEAEKGPGKVWVGARERVPPKEAAISTQANARAASTDTGSTRTNARGAGSKGRSPVKSSTPQAETAESSKKEKEREKKGKPGFDVVLTNAIAPGDEKAVLAAALSLPAGSTRSGRRVQRS